jgi:calcineurin-like phosphoesterase family protein
MNADMVRRYNEKVKPEDTVYFLGDIALGKGGLEYVKQLNGKKILIAGNHDLCHPMHKKSQKGMVVFKDLGFSEIHTEMPFILDSGIVIKMNHLPYAEDHSSIPRYGSFRPQNNGNWLLCGHVHNMWCVKDKQINVGVDVWGGSPVSMLEIVDIIESGVSNMKIGKIWMPS